MCAYGALEDEIVIDDYSLIVKRHGEIAHYSRLYKGEIAVSKTLFKPLKFEVTPFYPVTLPYKFTTYILVELLEKIVVPPRGEASIYIKIPVDIAVYVYGSLRRYKIIDVFSLDKVKYTLYGIPDRGVVARYHKCMPETDIPEPVKGEAVSLVNIRNRYDGWVEIGKVLLDAQILRLYYVPKSWAAYTQVVIMAVNSSSTATIYYGRRIEPHGRPIRDPPDLRPPRILAKTEMLWGLT